MSEDRPNQEEDAINNDIEEELQQADEEIFIEGVQLERGTNLRKSAFDDSEEIEVAAESITQILVPVAITMILVVVIIRSMSMFQYGGGGGGGGGFSYAMAYTESADDSTWTKLLGSLLNAFLIVVMLVVVTIIMVCLYKYRCLKVIYGWMVLSVVLMLGVLGGYLLYAIAANLNIAVDYFTFSILVWNFAVVGILSVFWHAPLRVNQGYLVIISAILATVFTQLPPWTTWSLLALIAIYDLFAVLCPGGPLKVLVETAQERDEPIPALIYSASVWIMMATSPEEAEAGEEDEDEEPKRGVKLGLGDFVFYSVLVGRAALFDILTVFTCFIAIVQGLFLTIILLAVYRKALPALPISIFFGLIFYFLTTVFLYPFVVSVGLTGVFV